jgi:hypothetical protein
VIVHHHETLCDPMLYASTRRGRDAVQMPLKHQINTDPNVASIGRNHSSFHASNGSRSLTDVTAKVYCFTAPEARNVQFTST